MAKFTITITQEEMLSIVRQHFNVTDDFEIKIENEESDNPWFDVPLNWKQTAPPLLARNFDKIEVMCRDGSTWINSPYNFSLAWWQEDRPDDIVRYRKAS